MEELQVVRALAALAHEARLRIFRALVVAGHEGSTPSALAEQLGIAPNTLSFHLKELAHAELVSQERQGRSVVYRAVFFMMDDLPAGEVCPVWPGHPAVAHWGYPDPSVVEGTDEQKFDAFKQTMFMIRRRIEILINLPHDKLQMSALQSTADELADL